MVWVGALTKALLEVIAIDGKTSRRSGRKGGKDKIHMVSAFAARQRLVLGQTKVNEKSNEIAAVPAWLRAFIFVVRTDAGVAFGLIAVANGQIAASLFIVVEITAD